MIEAPQRAQLGRSTTRCILRVWMNSEPVLKAAPQKKKNSSNSPQFNSSLSAF